MWRNWTFGLRIRQYVKYGNKWKRACATIIPSACFIPGNSDITMFICDLADALSPLPNVWKIFKIIFRNPLIVTLKRLQNWLAGCLCKIDASLWWGQGPPQPQGVIGQPDQNNNKSQLNLLTFDCGWNLIEMWPWYHNRCSSLASRHIEKTCKIFKTHFSMPKGDIFCCSV